jgi:pimeloyl-ACP methyl ester carboxylesterase
MSAATSGRAALLLPGGRGTADVPLLTYARVAIQRRGGRVHTVAWAQPARIRREDEAGLRFSAETSAWVASQVEFAIEETATATGVAAPILVGKSLGTLAAAVAANRGLPAVWFTPLLSDPPTVAALGRATAPVLLAGGTADPYWDAAVARSVTPHVVEVTGADHGLLVPGQLAASAAVLGQVMTAVEEFLDQYVWP